MKGNNFLKIVSAFGITLIFICCAITPVADSQSISIRTLTIIRDKLNDGSSHGYILDEPPQPLDDVWDVTLEFNEPGGAYDNVFFGEKTDASDGPDSYDVPKSPPGIPPYIRAWYNTGFSSPYHELWEEYKFYPDTNKYWNLTIQWVPSDYSSPTTVTISWDNTLVANSEYTSVVLYDVAGDINVADMLVDSSYAFTANALALKQFKILCNVNQPPDAVDDTATVVEDSSDNQIDVLANDNDPDGDTITINSVSDPSNGTASTDGTQVFYTPDPDFADSDSFTYTISDGNAGTDTATVNVTVTPVNDVPIANNDYYSTSEEITLNVAAPGVLDNDTDVDGDTLSAVEVSSPTDGTLTLNSDGSFSYIPNSNFSGSDSFTYQANDGTIDSNVATVFITVSGVNDPPVAYDDYYSTSEDSILDVIAPGVLGNDTDADGDTLTAIKVTNPTHGSVTLNSEGSFTYTPVANYYGADSFTYRANDGLVNSNTATVNIDVIGVNDDPVANDDTASVTEDSTNNQIDVLANDEDIDEDVLTIVTVGTPSQGSTTTDGNYVYYTPTANYYGSDSFTYTISDGNGGTDIGTVTVTVTGVNDAPNANDDSATVNEDSTNNQINVLANDNDPDGDNLDVTAITQPSNGTASFTIDFVFYSPNPQYTGPDQFTYTISDGNGGSDTATIFITVSGVNDPPVANDDSATVLEDSTNNQINVLSNDVDPDGDSLDISGVTQPSHGTATYTASNVFYTPNANYNGPDQFGYTITDNNGGSDSATVSIMVTSVNDPPNAVADSATVTEDSSNNQIDVLVNDNDPEGDSLEITGVTNPPHGTATYAIDYVYYTPDANYSGTDSFSYTIIDGNGGSDSATVSVTITAVNDPPVANNDIATVAEDSINNQINVLANDNDPDGDNIDVSGVSDPPHGTATYTIDYVFYTPDPDYTGPDSFTYTINDGNGGSDTATVSITVAPGNDPPIASDDSATVDEDSTNNQIDVLANDIDPDGDSVDITGVTQPTHGSVTYTAAYVFYTPAVNYFGSDQFSYTINDGNGGTDSATVSITVTGINDLPNANDDIVSVLEDSSNNQIDVLANDVDIDGDNLEITSTSVPNYGTVTYTVNYVFYTPVANYNGPDSFTYTISDGNGGSDSATVSITVTGVNDAPTAFDDSDTVVEDSSDNQIDVLANDVDIDGDDLDVTAVTQPSHGTATYTASYVYYSPDSDYSGADQFTYTISDGNGGSDSATITISVTPVNDPPNAIQDVATVLEDSSNNEIDVLINDIDPDGDAITIISITQPSHGTSTYTSDYVYYTPTADYSGSDSFSYTISDGNGGSDSAIVQITVGGTNDPPVANPDSKTVVEDSSDNQINVLTNDYDPDGDSIDITTITQPSYGTATYTADYVFYTPDPNYNGPDSLTYTISDGQGGSDSATVSITVSSVNDPPIATDDSVMAIEDSTNNQIDALGNDNDIDGDDLDVVGVTQPGHGTSTYTVGFVFYTPAANYNGPDQFSYTISDGHGGTDSATVYVMVTAVNDLPNAVDDTATVVEDSTNNQINVMANDVDIDGDDIDITGATDPTHGTTTFTVDYVYYTPDPDYSGTDLFSYTISDGNGGTDTASVTVTITAVNDVPNAVDDYISVAEDSTNNQLDVLFNDVDPDNDDLDITGATNPLHGSVTYNADYVFYSPNPDYTGSDQFSYSIKDNHGGTDSAIVFITVGGSNDPPIASDDSANVLEDSTNNQIIVLLNDQDPDGDNLTVISVGVPGHGTTSTDGQYCFYTPTPNYFGSDLFTYTISDGHGGTDIGNVNVMVSGVNDPPNANNDVATVVEDSLNNQIDVLSDDFDVDGDILDISGVTQPLHGSSIANGDYVFYTPDPDYNGFDQFNYTISDGNGATDTAIVYVTITGINDPPIANDDFATTNEDFSDVQINVLANDTDIDGDDLDITSVSTPAHGTVSFTVNYVFYTPDANYYGPDWFSYTISDNNGGTDSASIQVSVLPINDKPTAVPDSTSVAEDTIDNEIDVLLNDYDVDGDELSIVSVTNPTHGTATTDGNYTFYTPDPNYNGADSFKYTINDGNGGSSTATVYLSVTPTNDVPNPLPDYVSVQEDSTNNQIDVLFNDVDIDGDDLEITGVTTPLNGFALFSVDFVYYTPNADFQGSDQFNYSITDNNGGTNISTVFVTVGGSNDPPVANNDITAVPEDSLYNIIDVLINDYDPDGDNITIISVTDPAHGIATTNGSYVFYTPDENYSGLDSFMYTIYDGIATDFATVNITVNGINDPPVANDDFYSTFEDTQLNIAAPGVLYNDSDIDSSTLTAQLMSGPSNGTVSLNSDGSFIYTPQTNYIGTDSFTYRVFDTQAYSNTATVHLDVISQNDPPVANDDDYTTIEDAPLYISAPGILENDVDEENDPLTASLVTSPIHGTLSLVSDGAFTYTPNANYHGPDSFTYKANDGFSDSNIATVNIEITSVDDPPEASDDYYDTLEDTTLIINAPGVLINDNDPDDNNPLTAEKMTDPYGTLTFNSDGSFEFTPTLNFVGVDTFTYRANDSMNYSNIANVYINITPVNDPPTAQDDFAEVLQDSKDNKIDVLINDNDIDGDELTVNNVKQPPHGSVTYDGDFVYYTPKINFQGFDSFTYDISDGHGKFDTATVNITVRQINHAPTAPIINGPNTGSPNTQYNYAFISQDQDGDDVFYEILWGDGTVEEWIGPYTENEAVSIVKTWPEQGVYNLRARARDVHGATSDFTTFKVVIPRARFSIRNVILDFLDSLSEIFKSSHILIYLYSQIYDMWGGQ
jgi:VCBS repeat-containing protein